MVKITSRKITFLLYLLVKYLKKIMIKVTSRKAKMSTKKSWRLCIFSSLVIYPYKLYLVIFFKLFPLFLTAVSSNWRYVEHPTSKFNKCSPNINKKQKINKNKKTSIINEQKLFELHLSSPFNRNIQISNVMESEVNEFL